MPGGDYQPGERRPLASRDTGWAVAGARWLVRMGIAPNTISSWSMVFAALAAVALAAIAHTDGWVQRGLWLLVLLGVQLRLLANLFDGMVAVETGQASAVGELFNELPDRVSDTLILLALGLVPGSSLGWAAWAAGLALLVSYIRAVGAAAGAGQVFAGVMAKPRRMFAVSVLCALHFLLPGTWLQAVRLGNLGIDALVLVLISAGCVLTGWTRLRLIAGRLRETR